VKGIKKMDLIGKLTTSKSTDDAEWRMVNWRAGLPFTRLSTS